MSSDASPSYRYIVPSPDVRGGHARVEGTRVGVHNVIGLLQNGETVDSLVASCFPMLTKAQVYECLAYYEDIGARLTCWWHARWRTISGEVSVDHDVPEQAQGLQQAGCGMNQAN